MPTSQDVLEESEEGLNRPAVLVDQGEGKKGGQAYLSPAEPPAPSSGFVQNLSPLRPIPDPKSAIPNHKRAFAPRPPKGAKGRATFSRSRRFNASNLHPVGLQASTLRRAAPVPALTRRPAITGARSARPQRARASRVIHMAGQPGADEAPARRKQTPRPAEPTAHKAPRLRLNARIRNEVVDGIFGQTG